MFILSTTIEPVLIFLETTLLVYVCNNMPLFETIGVFHRSKVKVWNSGGFLEWTRINCKQNVHGGTRQEQS